MFKNSNCDYNLCIFNNNNRCTLDNIGINAEGCCDSIILPNIPENQLNLYKTETLTLNKIKLEK